MPSLPVSHHGSACVLLPKYHRLVREFMREHGVADQPVDSQGGDRVARSARNRVEPLTSRPLVKHCAIG
jgi:hypothetical protein